MAKGKGGSAQPKEKVQKVKEAPSKDARKVVFQEFDGREWSRGVTLGEESCRKAKRSSEAQLTNPRTRIRRAG